MRRIGTNAGGIPWTLPLVAAFLAGPAWAGSVTRHGVDQVGVKADRVPLGQLLRELAAVTPIPNLVIEPKLEQQTVTAFIEGASVAEAVRKTLEESGVQFLLWGGGAEPLGLYVGDLKKASLASPASKSPSAADLSAMSREERRAAREQVRAEKAEVAAAAAPPADVAPEDDTPPPDSFAALGMGGGDGSAAVQIGVGGAAGGAGGPSAVAPGQPIAGLPPPVRGVASWTEADGTTTHTTGYTIQGDTVIYDDPNFVSFKNSPQAKAARQNIDVSTLP